MPLIEVRPGTPVIPVGTYEATLIGIAPKRMTTKFSKPGVEDDFLEWTWLVDGPDSQVEITSLTSVATGPKSRIFEYLLALVGAEKAQIGAGFEENDLVGKTVMVKIVVTEDGFSRIETIVPALTKGSKAKNAASGDATPIETVKAPAGTDSGDDLPF